MSDRYIPEHRRTQFKAKGSFKPDELRRRREEQQVEIRKAKREENLAKRRGIAGRDGGVTAGPGASLGAAPDSDDEGGNIESQVRLQIFSLILPVKYRAHGGLLFCCLLSSFASLSLPLDVQGEPATGYSMYPIFIFTTACIECIPAISLEALGLTETTFLVE